MPSHPGAMLAWACSTGGRHYLHDSWLCTRPCSKHLEYIHTLNRILTAALQDRCYCSQVWKKRHREVRN